MKIGKRVLSVALSLCILLGMLPFGVQATQEETAKVETGNVTVEGTNSFGTMLSNEVAQQEIIEEEYSGAYNVIGLEIEGNVATVEYDSMEEAILVVAIYTEDGIQLLNSANTTVQPENTKAQVTFQGEMPEYFMASAYLVDTYDYSPLCSAYDTPMYTREMQELLSSTVDDYDSEQVLNLDDDPTTNFAVFSYGTRVIEYVEGVNTVTSVNEETKTYVISNADEYITSLYEGDIFAYSYGDNEILIVKVASITVDGTTATITGDEVEMEEVFSCVKLELDGGSANLSGEQEQAATFSRRAASPRNKLEEPLEYNLNKEFKTDSGNAVVTLKGSLVIDIEYDFNYFQYNDKDVISFRLHASADAKLDVSGKLEEEVDCGDKFFTPAPFVKIGFSPKLVVKFTGQILFNARIDFNTGFACYLGGEFHNLTTKPVVTTELKIEGTVYIGIDLRPTVEGSLGKFELVKAEIVVPLGVELTGVLHKVHDDSAESIHNCKKCIGYDLWLKGSIKPRLRVVGGKWYPEDGKAIPISLEIGKMYYSFDNEEFGVGSCPNVKYRVTVTAKDANGKVVPGVLVTAKNKVTGGIDLQATTNSTGNAVGHLATGKYSVSAIVDGQIVQKELTVEETCKLALNSKAVVSSKPSLSNKETSNKVQDNENFVDFGYCGAQRNNLTYTLTAYDDGVLEIKGKGKMVDYDTYNYGPYPPEAFYHAEKVVINEGVTSIGDHAFSFSAFNSIVIPNSVTSIGEIAFAHSMCTGSIVIPNSVTNIESGAFLDCQNLKSVTLPKKLTSIGTSMFYGCLSLTDITLPDSITRIGDYAFCSCWQLKNITIPAGVTSIGEAAFGSCRNLTSVTIPASVKSIDLAAFNDCGNLKDVYYGGTQAQWKKIDVCAGNEKLTDVTIHYSNEMQNNSIVATGNCGAQGDNVTYTIYSDGLLEISGNGKMMDYDIHNYTPKPPDEFLVAERLVIKEGVTSIGEDVFWDCNGLTSITLPSSITSIGDEAFYSCNGLTSITLPGSVTSIGAQAFDDCYGLTSITLPNSLRSISDGAFSHCDALTSITIPSGVTSIGDYAFSGCGALTSITIPNSVTSISDGAFSNCDALTSITIPSGVTSIGDYALYNCDALTSITIPSGVTSIGDYALYDCGALTSITIPNSVTNIGESAFAHCGNLKDVYYGGTQAQWSSIKIEGGNEDLENAKIHYGTAKASVLSVSASEMSQHLPPEEPTEEVEETVLPTYDEEEETESNTKKMVNFSGLVSGQEYLFLSLASLDGENPLNAENVLYIDQVVAGEDGKVAVVYNQRKETESAHVLICGPSNKNLKDATITFPVMDPSEEVRAVEPTVTYKDTTLVEGKDYVITGTTSYTAAGTYTCYIRGIYDYTGLIKCTYTVGNSSAPETSGIIRLAGSTRYKTAFAAADELKKINGVAKFDTIIVSSGEQFADALAGSYLAAAKNAPILLVKDSTVKAVKEYIQANLNPGGTVYLLGGKVAVPEKMETGLDGFNVKRLGGNTRYDTNLLILQEAGVAGKDIVVCTGKDFADSLSASAVGLPILLVKDSLNSAQKEFLSGNTGKIFVIGGVNAVSEKAEKQLAAYGNVTRLAGATRYKTSVLVAETFFQNPTAAVIAYGENFPDGLSGGPVAYALKSPLILTREGREKDAAAYITAKGIQSGYIQGGTTVLPEKTVNKVFGN